MTTPNISGDVNNGTLEQRAIDQDAADMTEAEEVVGFFESRFGHHSAA